VPSRPRAHQLEDLSRLALREVLPPSWIVRDLPQDYGLDAEVEIVTAEGAVTGRRFNVQLKATDDPAGCAIRLAATTAVYYRGLDMPVLLVLFRAADRQLRAQWFHALDRDFPQEQAEVTFRLDDGNDWAETTPAQLDAEVGAFRFFRAPGIPLPLRFALEAPDAEVLGEPSAEILRSVRAAAAETPGLVSFGESMHGAHVLVSGSETTVRLGAVASFSWPTDIETSDPRAFAYDVLLGCALALGQVGQVDLAARLAHRYAGRSALIADGQIVVDVADILVRAHRPTEALDIVDELEDDHPQRGGMSLYLMLTALRLSSLQSPHEIERYQVFLRRQIERGEESGDPHRLAIGHYNLANQFRSRSKRRAAFHHYRLALRAWPNYGDFEYFNREIAGVLYHSGRYQLAAEHYARALEIGSDWPLKGVLGDALMFSGRYREALARFTEATDEGEDGYGEWRLKRWLLENLFENWGADDQVRQTSAASALVEEAQASLSGVEAREAFHEALRLDWLSGFAWFNLGVAEEREIGDHEAALFAFIACGLCQPGDTEAWINAIVIAGNLGSAPVDAMLMELVAIYAYFANGDALLTELSRFARQQGDDFPVAEYVNAVEAAIRAAQPDAAAVTPTPAERGKVGHRRLEPTTDPRGTVRREL
jgi:tetratricopeptide (TPR) repeat protein